MIVKWLIGAACAFLITASAQAFDKMQMPGTGLNASVTVTLRGKLYTAFKVPFYAESEKTVTAFGRSFPVKLSAQWSTYPDETGESVELWIATDQTFYFIYKSNICGNLHLQAPLKSEQKNVVHTGIGECDIELSIFQ